MADSDPQTPEHYDIVFDGPPSHDAGRFVEVEDDQGRSIRLGKWIQRSDGFWVLRIPTSNIDRLPEDGATWRPRLRDEELARWKSVAAIADTFLWPCRRHEPDGCGDNCSHCRMIDALHAVGLGHDLKKGVKVWDDIPEPELETIYAPRSPWECFRDWLKKDRRGAGS